MFIETILKSPAEGLIHMERYVNKGSPSGFTFINTTSEMTSPFSDNATFLMPCLNVTKKNCMTEGDADRIPSIFKTDNSATVIYPVHPDILGEVLDEVDSEVSIAMDLPVYPTASARTVLFREQGELFFVKLHYPRLIGRFNRGLSYRKWISSFQNQFELIQAIDTLKAPKCFALLRQDIGHILRYNGDENNGMGMIFREFRAYPYQNNRVMIPFFSLVSKDVKNPQDPLLIEQLLGDKEPVAEKVFEDIIKPLLDCFRFQAIDLGLLNEYNAQNVLVEWCPDNGFTRIIHRDMMGTFKDLSRRRDLGLHTNFNNYHATDLMRDRNECFRRRSFAYDFKMGEYLLKEVETWLSERGSMSVQRFRNDVKKLFSKIVTQDTEEYFGSKDTWFGYEKKLPEGKRPYIENTNPCYR